MLIFVVILLVPILAAILALAGSKGVRHLNRDRAMSYKNKLRTMHSTEWHADRGNYRGIRFDPLAKASAVRVAAEAIAKHRRPPAAA